jgi:hypothetical protein
LDDFGRSLPVQPSSVVRDLPEFCSGIECTLEQTDFTGRTLCEGFEADFAAARSPDRPRRVWHSLGGGPATGNPDRDRQQLVSDDFKMVPPRRSLIDDVHEDRLFDVWRKNPGVIDRAHAIASSDTGFEVVDLRNVPVEVRFSWGRCGPNTEFRRFGPEPILAYRKPEKKDPDFAVIQALVYLSPEGGAIATPNAAGRPKSGVPSAFHPNLCVRGARRFPHPPPDSGFAW